MGSQELDMTKRLTLSLSGLPWWLRWLSIHLQCRRPGFHPWVGKIPWRRTWQPTPVFLPGESHGQRSLTGYSPWGRKELYTSPPSMYAHLQESHKAIALMPDSVELGGCWAHPWDVASMAIIRWAKHLGFVQACTPGHCIVWPGLRM